MFNFQSLAIFEAIFDELSSMIYIYFSFLYWMLNSWIIKLKISSTML